MDNQMKKTCFTDIWNLFKMTETMSNKEEDWTEIIDTAENYQQKYHGTPLDLFSAEMMVSVMKYAERELERKAGS